MKTHEPQYSMTNTLNVVPKYALNNLIFAHRNDWT